mgnify:CR=1 FL=1
MVTATKQLGKIGFDTDTGLYWGEILHLCDTETFYAASVDELRRLLRESVREHEQIRPPVAPLPHQPGGESVLLCLEPALFLQLSRQASAAGKNLNQYIVDILQEVVDHAPIAPAV